MRKQKRACRILVGKAEGKTPVRKSRWRWVNNIKMVLINTEWGDMD
jgi:hypothetical protein